MLGDLYVGRGGWCKIECVSLTASARSCWRGRSRARQHPNVSALNTLEEHRIVP